MERLRGPRPRTLGSPMRDTDTPPQKLAPLTLAPLTLAWSPAKSAGRALVLDGFQLLGCSKQALPQRVIAADVAGRGLTGANSDDLSYFTALESLDASDNSLGVFDLSQLPALRSLCLAYNRVHWIGPPVCEAPFRALLSLDLAYNAVSPDSIHDLSVLPLLRDLDLSGNNLATVPASMALLTSVQRLVLEHNHLTGDALDAVSRMPQLQVCSLAHNLLTHVPRDSCAADRFRALASLDLSFNLVAAESALFPLADVFLLEQVMCYGNPLLGSRGEERVARLQELCVRTREGRAGCRLAVLIDAPRTRLSKGRHTGRLGAYRSDQICSLSDRRLSADGFSIFAEALAVASEVTGARRAEPKRHRQVRARAEGGRRATRVARHLGLADGLPGAALASPKDPFARSLGEAQAVDHRPSQMKTALKAMSYTLRRGGRGGRGGRADMGAVLDMVSSVMDSAPPSRR